MKKYFLSETRSSLTNVWKPQVLVSSRIFCEPKTDVFEGFNLKLTMKSLKGLKEEINLLAAKISSSTSAMLFTAIFPPAQRACNFDISADRNAWQQSALRSLAIVYNSHRDPGSSAIVCDHMETSLNLYIYAIYL